MAGSARTQAQHVTWLEALQAEAGRFDFHVAMRRLECVYREMPRWGTALRPHEELIRLGQQPHLHFQPSPITEFEPPEPGRVGRLRVAFFGLFGPQGPLPLHLTEYARSRMLHEGDRSFAAFADLFHHRLLLLFHRAWATAQPTVGEDRSDSRFADFVGSTFGLGMPELRERDRIPDQAKLQYAAWLSSPSRSPDGLEAMVEDYFGIGATVEEFIGEWVHLPQDSRCRLGDGAEVAALGRTTILGGRVWCCTQKFRLVLGPLRARQLKRFLPDGDLLPELMALVRTYVGDELSWDARLVPQEQSSKQAALDGSHRLGWSSRLGRAAVVANQQEVVVHPASGRTSRSRRKTPRSEGEQTPNR